MSYVYDFMQGWKFIDSVKDRDRQLAEHAEDRAWQKQTRDWEMQRRADEEELKRWAEREKLILAYGFNPDGTEKPYEQLQQEGHLQDMLEMWNHPDFAPMRNAHGRDVKLTGVYGRGNQMIYTADVTDPKTGEVISRGMPLTQNRFTDAEDPDRKDPVRVVTMKQQLDDVRRGLIMKGQLYAQKYTQGQGAQYDRGLIDKAIGFSQPGAPSATPGAPGTDRFAGNTTRDFIYSGLTGRGMAPEMAKAAAVSAGDESGYNPGAVNKTNKEHSIGLFQWNGDRRDNLMRFAKARGKDWKDPDTQLDFFMSEQQTRDYMNGKYASGVEAHEAFVRNWERPAKEHADRRVAMHSNNPWLLGQEQAAQPQPQPASLAQGYPGAQPAPPQRAVTPEAEEALIREMDSAYEPRAAFTQANIDAVQNYADLLQTSAPALSSSYSDKLEAARQALPAGLARRVEQNPKQAAMDARGFLQVAQQPAVAPRAAASQAPIDRSRPIINNPDGTFSTERTITVEADGKHYLIPTIVNGQQLTPEQAIEAVKAGKNAPVGVFNTAQEAEAAAQARSQRIGQVRGGEAIPPRGALTSPSAPGAQPVEFSPQPKAQLTAEQQREQRGVLTEMVQRKIISLKDAQEIARTGQLGGEDLKFVADGYGGVGVFHPRTGQQVAYHENPTIQALKAQGSRRRGSNSEGKGSEYAKTRIELEAKAYKNAPWAKGADGKYDPDLVERDIRRTLAVNRPVLVEWGFPPETADWTEADWDRYLEWYGQSRKGDKEEGHWANFLPGVDVTYRTDTQGQLNQTVARGNGPQEPVMQLPDGRVVNLQKMVAAGVAPDLETARQMVEQALRSQGAN